MRTKPYAVNQLNTVHPAVHPANEYLQYFHATLYNGPGGVVPAKPALEVFSRGAGIQADGCGRDLQAHVVPAEAGIQADGCGRDPQEHVVPAGAGIQAK